MSAAIEIIAVEGMDEIEPGDDIAGAVLVALAAQGDGLEDGDVLVVTQKIVSKAENRLEPVDVSRPNDHHRLVLDEARRIVRRRGDLLITETHHGFVCANSGVDLSNVAAGTAALLPRDPDRSARRIRDRLRGADGPEVGVIISDTFGRPWRRGLTDVAIGVAGVAAVVDLRGETDAVGRELAVTEVAVADELAGAAELVMGKQKAIPAAVVRGVDGSWLREATVADEMVRPAEEDLFR